MRTHPQDSEPLMLDAADTAHALGLETAALSDLKKAVDAAHDGGGAGAGGGGSDHAALIGALTAAIAKCEESVPNLKVLGLPELKEAEALRKQLQQQAKALRDLTATLAECEGQAGRADGRDLEELQQAYSQAVAAGVGKAHPDLAAARRLIRSLQDAMASKEEAAREKDSARRAAEQAAKREDDEKRSREASVRDVERSIKESIAAGW